MLEKLQLCAEIILIALTFLNDFNTTAAISTTILIIQLCITVSSLHNKTFAKVITITEIQWTRKKLLKTYTTLLSRYMSIIFYRTFTN